jgi:hypothetical protein
MEPTYRTSPLTPEQYARIDALLDELFDLPEKERARGLSSLSTEDPAVISEVESLLRAARSTQGFLSAPARLAQPNVAQEMAVGAQCGAWRITRLVGRGGMGEVYEAVRAQADFEQRVAIKILQHEAAEQLERFQVERQILARLDHPGIARLYDGGITEDGRPYMVMEYVQGRAITDYCEATGATLQQRLRLFFQVCEAVAYAHRNLVIHRDLKPSNILVTRDGQVKLLDFGIAKLIDSQLARVTQGSAAPLTPICAAPEQLNGQPVTTATDVYALGVLLFELLTGTHPWMTGDTPMLAAMRAVLHRPASSASGMIESRPTAPVPARLVRGDLDAIVAKALRAEPEHRYTTVEAFKDDVARVLAGEPVEARTGVRLYVLGHVLRRYRWAAAAAAAIFISLAGGLGIAGWQAQRAGIERDVARRDAAREEALRYNLTSLFHGALADRGGQPASAKDMIDNSSQRVLREYRDEPQLAGQLVLTLADLYGALEDVTGAAALLEGYVAEARPDMDPVSLADARQKLANIELLRGHTDRAAELLAQAEAFWDKSPQSFVEERLEELAVRVKLQRARGDLDGAIATSRAAIAERIAHSGHDHRETALLYNSLAISLAAANRLDEALAAYRETTAIYRAIGLGDGLDAQIIMANSGTLELRTGHLREAETTLKSAFERERALAGDSAAVAAAMGYYGKLLTITNRNDEALPLLRNAAELGDRYAGPNSPLALQNRLFLGESQLAGGDRSGARTTLSAAHNAASAQYGAGHLLTLRIQMALAQVAAADSQVAQAHTQLASVIAGLRKLGVQGNGSRAQALVYLGELEMSEGRQQQAIVLLQEAVTLSDAQNQSWDPVTARAKLALAQARGVHGT